jgi:hypothetical protein
VIKNEVMHLEVLDSAGHDMGRVLWVMKSTANRGRCVERIATKLPAPPPRRAPARIGIHISRSVKTFCAGSVAVGTPN